MHALAAAGRTGGTRFQTLDGLRGLAAIAVLISHIAPSICTITVLRNWYAVDLFFMISGFVLCRVYEPRFRTGLTAGQFMLQRYIRLYPLFALGLLFGLVAETLAVLAHQPLFDGWQRAIALTTGLAILPSPTMDATPEIIPLNAVGWSLFFELAANFVYVVFWPRLSKRVLMMIVAASALDLLWSAHHGTSFGGTSWSSFWGGFPRVTFCFFTGVLIARTLHERRRVSGLAWLPIPLLLGLLFVPWRDGDVRDVLIMMLAFPSIIAFAAGVEPPRPRLFSLAGRLSYPVYAVHYPLYLCLAHGLFLLGMMPDALAPWGGIAFAVAICIVGQMLDRYYDTPLRRWLTRMLAARQSLQTPVPRANRPLA